MPPVSAIRPLFVALVVAVSTLAPATSASAARSDVPKTCKQPPVTMRVEATGAVPVGGKTFRVTDGVARRVPLVPRPPGSTTSDPKELVRQREEAASTDLALYSIYLADFHIPRRELRGSGFGEVTPEGTGTIATLSLVPEKRRGFEEGDVVRDREPRYETTTTFAPLSLIVVSAANDELRGYTDVQGRVKILALDERSICVHIDVEFLNSGSLVTAARGTVAVPVVEAGEGFYFN
jgi:hypothetical protein